MIKVIFYTAMITTLYQIKLSAQGSEIALLCQRGKGISQLSCKTKQKKNQTSVNKHN